MTINKHGSFYLRSGWGTKIIEAVNEDPMIFSPANEPAAVDNIGLGRVMIKALRYWSDVIGLTNEVKVQGGICHERTQLFNLIQEYDPYFQKAGTLLLLHRNLACAEEKATAWYWAFNELSGMQFDKDQFVNGLHSYLAVNGTAVKKNTVEKEYNCFKNTYIGNRKIDKGSAMDEDTYPLFGPLHLLKVNDEKKIEKVSLTKTDIPLSILVYSITEDNLEAVENGNQISMDTLMEEPKQVGKYLNIKYSDLIDMLLEAENKNLLSLNNNFGNRFIEFTERDYAGLLQHYFAEEDE